jgi:hypothetical protein
LACATKDPQLKSFHSTVLRNDDWQLVWMDTSRKFYFCNLLTKEENRVPVRQGDHRTVVKDDDLSNPNTPALPTLDQKLDALEAAINNGYDLATLKLLDYGINLNEEISSKVCTELPRNGQ